MTCPYCASEISDAALVCPVCRRELFLVRQLMQRIEVLEAQLHHMPAAASEEPPATAEGEPPLAAPVLPVRAPDWRVAGLAWLAPLLLLLLAHWLIVFVYDSKLLYLRVFALLIPLPFGFVFARATQRRFLWNLLPAFIMAGIAVFGMSAVTGWLDQVPVLPQGMVDVREFLEFSVSIGFSFVTGLWLQDWLQKRDEQRLLQLQALRRRLGPLALANSQEMADSLTRLNDIGSAVIGVATSAVSIYTGLKGFLGG